MSAFFIVAIRGTAGIPFPEAAVHPMGAVGLAGFALGPAGGRPKLSEKTFRAATVSDKLYKNPGL